MNSEEIINLLESKGEESFKIKMNQFDINTSRALGVKVMIKKHCSID